MPLLQEWKINDTALGAIWKIEEPETFFIEQTGITSDIKNDKRRIEHLAGRFLLLHLEKDFPLQHIYKDEHDKPRVRHRQLHFSISHSWPYVAAVIDTEKDAGIDIQTWHPRISAIRHKFLSASEQALLKNQDKLYILGWCAKEAVYKWNGRRGIEFIEELPIMNISEKRNINIFIKQNKCEQIISVNNIMNTDFACAYVNSVRFLSNL